MKIHPLKGKLRMIRFLDTMNPLNSEIIQYLKIKIKEITIDLS